MRPSAYHFLAGVMGLLAATGLITLSFSNPPPREVTVPLSEVSGTGDGSCFVVTSQSHWDHFCLRVSDTPGGVALTVVLDHGPLTDGATWSIVDAGLCISGCPSFEVWEPSDGSGRVLWNFGNGSVASTVTLRAL